MIKRAIRRVTGPSLYESAHLLKVRARRWRRLLTGDDPWLRTEIDTVIEKHGEWYLCPTPLTDRSIIYSLGVGEDISFDLSVIKRFGADVYAFDPTPRATAWIRHQTVPSKFHFVEMGVAAFDGVADFSLPTDPKNASFRYGRDVDSATETVRCPVRRLTTLMTALGHSEIDLLKMDIEGAEYEVIEDMVAGDLPIKQILVEFHHRKAGIGVHRTRQAIDHLERRDFRLFHISPSGEELAFVRSGRPA